MGLLKLQEDGAVVVGSDPHVAVDCQRCHAGAWFLDIDVTAVKPECEAIPSLIVFLRCSADTDLFAVTTIVPIPVCNASVTST